MGYMSYMVTWLHRACRGIVDLGTLSFHFVENSRSTTKCLDKVADKVGRSISARVAVVLAALVLSFQPAGAAETNVIYQNNFEKAEVGKLPDEFLVLDGAFAIKEEAGNKFLELPGAPLDTFGMLFGP